jgi:hypothetical protein
MDIAPCPLLSAYLKQLREHLNKAPLLHDAELDELDELEEVIATVTSKETLLLRATVCLEEALGEVANQLKTYPGSAVPVVLFEAAMVSPEKVGAVLDHLIEGHQVAAGEMGLLGVRRDGQQLEYARHEEATALGEQCKELTATVSFLQTATRRVDVTVRGAVIGVLFWKTLLLAKTPMARCVGYLKKLLDTKAGSFPYEREPATILGR